MVAIIAARYVPQRPSSNDKSSTKKKRSHRECVHQKKLSKKSLSLHAWWVNIITEMYGVGLNAWTPKFPNGNLGTSLWRPMLRFWDRLEEFVKYVPGNGVHISFWESNWCSARPLKDTFLILYSLCREQKVSMSNCWDGNLWCIEFRQRRLSENDAINFANLLAALSTTLRPAVQDRRELVGSYKGFTVGNYRKLLVDKRTERLQTMISEYPWKKVWRSDTMPSANFTLWLSSLGKLPTDKGLLRRHMILVTHCRLCYAAEETNVHIFCLCPYTLTAWRILAAACNTTPPTGGSMVECLRNWKPRIVTEVGKLISKLVFHAVVYCVWSERCKRVHEGKSSRDVQLLFEILTTLWSWSKTARIINSITLDKFSSD